MEKAEIDNIFSELNSIKKELDPLLKERFKGEFKLEEVGKYSIFSGGKRVRPGIAVLFGKDLGIDSKSILPLTLCLELLHCSSLIHDDLPALDDDDYRRGELASHKKFGEASAILAGDYLIAEAFLSLEKTKIDSKIKNQILHSLADTFKKLCIGQHLDLSNSEREKNLIKIHELKTGALFSLSLSIPGYVKGYNDQALEIINDLGVNIGVLFQLVDDYLDLFGTEEQTGKKESSDLKQEKINAFSDINLGKELLKKYYQEIFDLISKLKMETKINEFSNLEKIINLIFSRAELKID